MSELILAAHAGRAAAVAALLADGADVNDTHGDGITPLYAACETGRTEIVKKLLAANADANQATNHGYTPLHMACEKNFHITKELHTLRKWRNLSEHSDPGRWKREGPRREKVVELIESLDAQVCDLEARVAGT